jgi:hypothetical protein
MLDVATERGFGYALNKDAHDENTFTVVAAPLVL